MAALGVLTYSNSTLKKTNLIFKRQKFDKSINWPVLVFIIIVYQKKTICIQYYVICLYNIKRIAAEIGLSSCWKVSFFLLAPIDFRIFEN